MVTHPNTASLRPGLSAGILSLLIAASAPAADVIDGLWSIRPGDRDYVTVTNSERGMAYSPATGHVLLVSRASGANIYVLDGDDGSEVNLMNTDPSIVTGGTFAISMIGVADDGVVYAANLSTSTTTPNFKIYRWANDLADTEPTIAYEGDPAGINEDTGQSNNPQRWGDSLDVRGSGVNTQIVAASRGSAAVAIFTTTDGINFTPTFIPNAAGGSGSLSVAFGPGDTLYSTSLSTPLRRVQFDLGSANATLLNDYAVAAFPGSIVPIAIDPAKNRLGALDFIAGPDRVALYDISDPTGAPVQSSESALADDNPNGNATGAADLSSNRLYVLSTNNGLHAFEIEDSAFIEPPVITTGPAAATVIEGGNLTLGVAVSGTPPLTYQWAKRVGETFEPIDGATAAELTIAGVTAADAGEYLVTVTNDGGSATSNPAEIIVLPRTDSDVLTPAWTASITDKAYLETDNAHRGVGINPTNGNILVVSRTGGTKVYVLSGETGADLHNLDVEGIAGGIFTLNMIGVANDGVVYACNLSLGGDDFKIYRWDDDAPDTFPDFAYDAAFSGNPGVGRIGDTFAVRGSGVNTQLLVASRSGRQVLVFTTSNGRDFEPTVIDVADATDGNFGLGVAFGLGNTFWGKATGQSLRHVEFNLGTGEGTTLHDFPTSIFPASIGPIAVDPDAGYLSGVSFESPDNVRIYSIADLNNAPVLLDQEFFASDNANINGTGAVGFAGDRLVALSTNNGIATFTVSRTTGPDAEPTITNVEQVTIQGNPFIRFQLNGQPGKSYLIQRSIDAMAWSDVATITLEDEPSELLLYPITVSNTLYRAVELTD